MPKGTRELSGLLELRAPSRQLSGINLDINAVLKSERLGLGKRRVLTGHGSRMVIANPLLFEHAITSFEIVNQPGPPCHAYQFLV